MLSCSTDLECAKSVGRYKLTKPSPVIKREVCFTSSLTNKNSINPNCVRAIFQHSGLFTYLVNLNLSSPVRHSSLHASKKINIYQQILLLKLSLSIPELQKNN